MLLTIAIVVTVSVLTLGSLVVMFKRDMRKLARTQAALHATPRTPIGDLVDGAFVRVVGTAAGDEQLKAPFSGTWCVAFWAQSKAYVADGNDFRRTIASAPSEDVVAFRVQDDTGAVDIDIEHVKLVLADHLVAAPDHAFGASIVARESDGADYREGLLVLGGRVAVSGVARRGADGVLRLVGTAAEPLVVSNQPGALEG